MVGIDAADIHFIRTSPARLPRLRGLLDSGRVFRFESSIELTSSVWPTFSTGKQAGEHGAYYPMQWDPAGMQLRRVSADWIYYEPFWYELARQGTRVTVLDVPFSMPSKLERGLEVLNWGSQECLGPFDSNRADLARAIRQRFGEHPMGAEVPVEEAPPRLERIRKNLVAGARRKGELARWLMEAAEWDLFIAVFAECHRAGHTLWPEQGSRNTPVPPDALAEVYEAVDGAVGHVVDGADPNTAVLVFSMHGMRANRTQEHFILPMMERVNAAFEQPAVQASEPKKNPMRFLREAVPPSLQQRIASAVPAGVRDWVVRRSFCGGLDWTRTRGFALPSSGEGYIRLNLAGREAQGSLDPASGAYGRYKAWLKHGILSFKDAATGAPAAKDVKFTADIYPGPRSGFLPDAVILWNDLPPAREIVSETLGRLSARLATGRTGEHQPEGFAVLSGNGAGLETAPPLEQVADFAPFAAHVLQRAARFSHTI
jgi:predicted AlkP superfamily phosphohydrolase/phosphomutase